MKRFFGLMLVAMLLVSAISMQAFAMGFPGGGNVGGGFPGGGNIGGNMGGFTCQHNYGTTFKETKVAATCEDGGIDIHTCNMPYCGEEIEVPTDKLNHIEVIDAAVAATCTDKGLTAGSHCGREGCGEVLVAQEEVPALQHAWGEFETTKEATCKEAGEKVRVCANNAEHKDIQPIDKLTTHSFEDGVCSVCGEKKGYGLTFKYKNANGEWTSTILNVQVGDRINAPEVPYVSGLKHTGWNNGLQDGYTKFYPGMATEYTATYVESTDDGLVDLTVYAYYYVDGEYHHKAKLFVEEFEESRKGNMVRWLYSEGVDAVDAALAAEHGADGYQWDSVKFYNCYDDGEVSEWEDLRTNGNKSVYVKINSKKAIEATILLHIHTKQEYAIARTIKMAGYTAGDFVSYNDALAKVKNYYTGSKLEMSDLYDEGDWDDLMDGLKSSGSKTIKVEDNGTTEIHVIVKNATSKTSSNADTTNPKTGDSIMIAVGTMAMAAAALVTLAELKKRKMI